MPVQGFDLTSTLGTGLNSSTNPNPNTLSVVSPYGASIQNFMSVSPAWTAQGYKALFPTGKHYEEGLQQLKLHFVPSDGPSVTATVNLYIFDRNSNTWASPDPSLQQSISLTGDMYSYIYQPGNDPIFLNLANISSGSYAIYFDGSLAVAL